MAKSAVWCSRCRTQKLSMGLHQAGPCLASRAIKGGTVIIYIVCVCGQRDGAGGRGMRGGRGKGSVTRSIDLC